MQERQTWTGEIAPRYRQSDKKGKTRILDEFVQAAGYNRKYALYIRGKEIWLTVDGKPVKLKAVPTGNRKGKAARRKGGGRKPVYEPEVIASLRLVWAFFCYPCGKLLAPLMRDQMPCIAAWTAFGITEEIRKKLLTISPTTIDRALKVDRNKLAPKGISGTKPGKLLKKHIPVRTHYPWNERTLGGSKLTPFIIAENGIPGSFALPLPPQMSLPVG
jgi:hypothetical protein